MNAKKLYYTMLSVVVFLIIFAGVLVYFGNQAMKKSALNLVNAKLDIMQKDQQEIGYLKAKKDLEKYKDISDLVDKVLPKDKDQARAVGEIYKIGSESNISIDRIQFPSSTLGLKATSTTATPTAATAATTAATPTVTQAKPVEGLKSVQGIDVEIASSPGMKYNDMITFLQKIESNRRSMQVKKIAVRPDLDKKVLAFDITVTIFVKP